MGAGEHLEGSGTVIMLTGPSSTGKTSVATRLQMVLKRPTVFLAGDDLDLPDDSEARRTLLLVPSERVALLEAAFLRGYFGALASFAANGVHAIGEVLFKNESQFRWFQEQTGSVPTRVVHLRCADETRTARERQRSDRPPGIAELTGTQEWIPPQVDLAIDTTTADPQEAAALIASQLQ
jgi:chloramphenicol 3-O phosphotransferase